MGIPLPAERSESRKPLDAYKMALSVPLHALASTEALSREVSRVAISETVLVLAGGTAVLSILFGMRVAMRAVAGGAAAPRSNGGRAGRGYGRRGGKPVGDRVGGAAAVGDQRRRHSAGGALSGTQVRRCLPRL